MKKYFVRITLLLLLFFFTFGTTCLYSKNIDYNDGVVVFKNGGAISGDFIKKNKNIILKNHNQTIKLEDIDEIFPYKKDFLEVAFNRNSCLVFKYGPEIPDKDIELMLKVAMTYPSGCDVRACHFIVVKDRQKIQNLLKPFADRVGEGRVGRGRVDANLMFVLCGKIDDIEQNFGTDFFVCGLMLWLAAEYLDYAAAYVDIISPHISSERKILFKKELSIPDDVTPFNMILVGYYDGVKCPKNRFDNTRIHNDIWTNK